MRFLILLLCILGAQSAAAAERRLNNGNLILQDVPDVPPGIAAALNRYQNVRSASFQAWDSDGAQIFVRTRFGDVAQLHRVSRPGGARFQLTFNTEPIGPVSRAPGGTRLAFTMDTGGSEFSQLFLFDPDTGVSKMLTDGQSRNNNPVWNRDGSAMAYTSTERNGRSNDVWLATVDQPGGRRLILEAGDGTLWAAADFSEDGTRLLLINYVSVTDSRIHLLDPATGSTRLLAGGGTVPSANYPVGFDEDGRGFFFLTDQGGEFTRLARASLDKPAAVTYVSAGIDWNVENAALSDDRRRGAFVVNAGGVSELYLLDTGSGQYRKVETLPAGVIGGVGFSPDGLSLAMTLNTPKTPSDTFVLSLGRGATDYGALTRWTHSEVGGLDADTFIEPALIAYETFDDRRIPAFYYRPGAGDGPFPVVISIHGGPEGQARPTFSATYQMWLQQLGVAVLVPNVRGSSGYGRAWLQLDNGFLREDSVRDIGALLDWVATRPELDRDRVAVFGGSYGGYMVLAAAVHYSDRLRAAVDVVGISNFVTFLTNTQDYRRDLRRVEYGDERDPKMREFLNRISPLNNTDKIKIPMLVVQGQNDPRVPVTESEQLVEALRRRDLPVWYMNALNEGHGYARKENRDVYRQVTALFLRRHLLGK